MKFNTDVENTKNLLYIKILHKVPYCNQLILESLVPPLGAVYRIVRHFNS